VLKELQVAIQLLVTGAVSAAVAAPGLVFLERRSKTFRLFPSSFDST